MREIKKGFTLIELMIVVAIIGVLAVTILPQLTGAQARARDAGRIATVNNVKAILETYFSDLGKFPGIEGTKCFDNELAKDDNLKGLLSKGKVPVDPQRGNVSKPCSTGGFLGYQPLEKNGTKFASYLLTSNVELTVKANTDLSQATTKDYDGYEKVVGSFSGTTSTNPGDLVYAELY